MKGKIIKIKACRKKNGCEKGDRSWETMTGKTFEIKKAA